MIRSLLSGLSGIKSNQVSLDVIGNNIANINTPSFKGGRPSFTDTLSQTIRSGTAPSSNQGGLDPMQIGRGSSLGSINTVFTQGSMETTDNPTDLAIAGEGFFILRYGNQDFYTRDGSFDVDAQGTLVDPSTGYAVQGRMADSSGNILSSTPISDVALPIESLFPARATTSLSYAGNLDATSDLAVNSAFNVTDDGTMIDDGAGGGLDNGSVSATLTTAFATSGITLSDPTVTVDTTGQEWRIVDNDRTFYVENDGAGEMHIHTVAPEFTLAAQAGTTTDLDATTVSSELRDAFEQNGTPLSTNPTVTVNTAGERWTITDGIDVIKTYYIENDGSNGLTVYPEISQTGTYQTSVVVYDSLGDSHNVTITFARDSADSWRWVGELSDSGTNIISQTPVVANGMLTFKTDGTLDTGGHASINIQGAAGGGADLDNGADSIGIDLDLSQLVQYAGSFTPVPASRNGHSAGALESINFNETGTLIGTFTNGATQKLAQVVLADFYNPAGLTAVGENMYSVSMNSGSPLIGTAGTSIRASIVPGALEGSNVDLASEFTKMIVAQRGFEANSRLVATSDGILGELINLKR